MPRRSIFSFSLRSPRPDHGYKDQQTSTAPDLSPVDSDSTSLRNPQDPARYIPRQWQPNRLATLYVTPSEENLYLAAMASLDQPPPTLALWAESAPQIPPHRQPTPLDVPTTAATKQRFNLPLSPKMVTSPTLPPEGLTVRDEFRSFAHMHTPGTGTGGMNGTGVGAGGQHALVAFAEDSTIRFHNFPHRTLVQLEQDLEVAWPRGFSRKQPTLDKLKDRSEETGHTWIVSMKGRVWRKAGNEELASIRLVLALLTSLGMQGWQLVEKVQATGMRTDHHNLLFVQSQEMASFPPAFFAISIPLPDRISLISPPNKVIPALISAIRGAIISQDRHQPGAGNGQPLGRRNSQSSQMSRRHSIVEWDAWKGGIKLEGFVHPGVYRFWIDGLRRWLSGAVKWNVVEKLHPPLILALINALGAENFHLLTSLPLLPLQKGRDVLIFQSVPASGLSYLDTWRDIPSVAPTIFGGSIAGDAPVIVQREDAVPSRGEILPRELHEGRNTRQRQRERGWDDHPREHTDMGMRRVPDGRLKRHASVDSRPDMLDNTPAPAPARFADPHVHAPHHDHPHGAMMGHRQGHMDVPTPATGSSDLTPPRPMPIFDDHERPLTPESVREQQQQAQSQGQRKRNVLTKKPSLKDAKEAQEAQAARALRQYRAEESHSQPQSQNQARPRRSFSFGRMKGYRKPSLRGGNAKGSRESSEQDGYGGLEGGVMPQAVNPRSRHGIGSDATGELLPRPEAGTGLGGLAGGDWSLVDLPRTGEGLGLTMYAPSRRMSGDEAQVGSRIGEAGERGQGAHTSVESQGMPRAAQTPHSHDHGHGDLHDHDHAHAQVHLELNQGVMQAMPQVAHTQARQQQQQQQQKLDQPKPPQRELSTPALPMPGAYTTSVAPPALTRESTGIGAAISNIGTGAPITRTLHNQPSFDSTASASEYHEAPDHPTWQQNPTRGLHIANPTPPPQTVLSDRYPSGTNANLAVPGPDPVMPHHIQQKHAIPDPGQNILPLRSDNRMSQYTYSSEPMTSALATGNVMPLGAPLNVPLSPDTPVQRGRNAGLVDVGSVFGVQSVAGSVGFMGSQSVLGITPDRRSVPLPDAGPTMSAQGTQVGGGPYGRDPQYQGGAMASPTVPGPPVQPISTADKRIDEGSPGKGKGKSKDDAAERILDKGKKWFVGNGSNTAGSSKTNEGGYRDSVASVATGEAGPGPGSRRTKVHVG